MTTDLKDSKIAEVYELDHAEEMTDIYIDLTDLIDGMSRNYWKLVKALAKIEKDRDDLSMKYNGLLEEHNKTLKKYDEVIKKDNKALEDIVN